MHLGRCEFHSPVDLANGLSGATVMSKGKWLLVGTLVGGFALFLGHPSPEQYREHVTSEILKHPGDDEVVYGHNGAYLNHMIVPHIAQYETYETTGPVSLYTVKDDDQTLVVCRGISFLILECA